MSTAAPPPSTSASASASARDSFQAARIGLYIDAGVIEGQGGTRVTLGAAAGGQCAATADAFTYDLRTGRLLLAGHVDLTDNATHRHVRAAAVVSTPTGQIYALVTQPTPRREELNPQTLEPIAPHAPSDAFAFPTLAGSPWMRASSAEVIPGTLVTLRHATFLYPVHGATVPSYVYVFSPNPYYAASTLPFASFDQPWPFYGNANALDTLHVRYDQGGGASLGFDHRLVFGDRAYALFSLAPLTQSGRNAALTLYQRMSPSLYQSFTAIGYRQGNPFTTPTQADAYLAYSVTDALRQSYLQLSLDQAYDSLVAGGVPNHPSQSQLGWYGYDQPLGRSGIHYRLHSSLGFARDAFGLGAQVAPATAQQAWVKGAGLSLSSPVVTAPLQIQLSAFDDRELSWFSTGPGYGRWSNDLVLTGARRVSQRLGTVATYESQLASSPASLYRTSTLNLTYDVPARAQLVVSLQNDNDVLPVGYFPRPPYVASIDLRLRVTRYGTLDIQRSYYFNFEGQTWSPQFTLSLLP